MINLVKITIDEERCVKCDECVDVCPTDVFAEGSEATNGFPTVQSVADCIECFSCKDVCRSDALIFEDVKEVQRLIVDEKLIQKVRKII